jgi:hypothetical protein
LRIFHRDNGLVASAEAGTEREVAEEREPPDRQG